MTDKRNILVIDDEAGMLEVCSDSLKKLPHLSVATENGGLLALKRLESEKFDLLLVDLKMPDIDGLEVLKKAKKIDPETVVMMMTAFPTIESAVEAVKEGALDYIVKPFTPDQLRISIVRALHQKKLAEQNRLLAREVEKEYRMGSIIGKSKAMQSVFELIDKVAATHTEVLIVGESGTGKELIARAIHARSSRKNEKFVPVDCGAIPENLLESEFFGFEKGAFTGAEASTPGLLEYASGGTFFLDEVCELTPILQAKLLRVLQERSVRRVGGKKEKLIDVRLMAATNRNIEEEVREKRFREDLYYRLNVMRIAAPPLRERKEDIPLIVSHYLGRFNKELGKKISGISEDALEIFRHYSWPGNIRELQNVLKRGVILAQDKELTMEDIPEEIVAGSEKAKELSEPGFFAERSQQIDQFEKDYLMRILKNSNGDVSTAAKKANIPRGTFYRLLKKHQISADPFRKQPSC